MVLTPIQLQAISEISFLAFALVIALYALIIQTVEKLVEKRIKDLRKAIDGRDEALDNLGKDKGNKELKHKYMLLDGKVDDLEGIPYHLNFGYIITGIFFALALFFSFVPQYFGSEILGSLAVLIEYSPLFLIIGILSLFFVWFQTMTNLRSYTLEKFDEFQEQEQKKEPEIKKKLEKIDFKKTE